MEVAIAGGHGRVALLLGAILVERGNAVWGLIRDPAQEDDLHAVGVEPVVCDLEHEHDVHAAVRGADAVVFAAGAGPGSGAERKRTMDLGGALKLKSKPGEGVQATLWLPVAETRPVEAEVAAVQAPPHRTATILLVDDDPLIAMSTTDMLEDLGHTVIQRNSGAGALDVLRGGEGVDLLMTDYAMPGMTGIDLAGAARALRPHMPILLATGYADVPEGSRIDLPRLAKPYRQSQLRIEIDRLLEAYAPT